MKGPESLLLDPQAHRLLDGEWNELYVRSRFELATHLNVEVEDPNLLLLRPGFQAEMRLVSRRSAPTLEFRCMMVCAVDAETRTLEALLFPFIAQTRVRGASASDFLWLQFAPGPTGFSWQSRGWQPDEFEEYGRFEAWI